MNLLIRLGWYWDVRGQLGDLVKPFIFRRLHDVLHSDKKLTLVFEFCDQVKEGLGGILILGGCRSPN